MLDNRDSFVYNLVEELRAVAESVQVYRNDIQAAEFVKKARAEKAVICLSPGPGTPQSAGSMMEIISLAQAEKMALVGVCLGFQALVASGGAKVERVGAVHGESHRMELTEAGRQVYHFASKTLQIGRYHSLGTYQLPAPWQSWGTTNGIIMAGGCQETASAGVQFHPESILTPEGAKILSATLDFTARAARF